MILYVILPVHNRRCITEKFIRALISQTYSNYKLILVDDGSTDGTAEMVLSYLPESVVLRGDGNLWWAGALQKAYDWLREYATDEDICLIINDDVTFDENFLEIGVNKISSMEKTLLLAYCYKRDNFDLIDRGVNFDYRTLSFKQVERIEEINCLSTRGLFLRFKDFKEIGGFYPKLLPHYLSDYEFTIRAYRKGFRLLTSENLKLYLDTSATGVHHIENYKSFFEYYAIYFSNRNSLNPLHWINFVVLAVPFPYKILHVLKISLRMIRDLLKPFVRVFKIKFSMLFFLKEIIYLMVEAAK